MLSRIAIAAAVAFSLLAFPVLLPAVIAGWILAAVACRVTDGPAGFVLLAGAVTAAAKLPDFSPAMIAMIFALAAGALLIRRLPTLAIAGVAAAWMVLAIEARGATRAPERRLEPDRPIVCLGDSLTTRGYPDELRKRVRVPIVDFGAPGISTRDAVDRIAEIRALRPQVLVIELGGHDFLQGRSRAETRANLERLFAVDATVILFEIPRGIVVDPYRGLERELARRHDLELVDDSSIRALVFAPGLSDDGIHPNARGNAWLADRVAAALVRIFGPEVLRTKM